MKKKGAAKININIFRKPYIIRRFRTQNIDNAGYPKTEYYDFKTLLNVQQVPANELQALPEGERTIKRVKTYGADKLQAADENTQINGDRLYYHGFWYECKSSNQWEYNLFSLAHFESVFAILPPDKQKEMGVPEI